MGLTVVKVVGQLIGSNGEPIAGQPVVATLSEIIHNSGTTASTTPLNTLTSATGAFELDLFANTDEGTAPQGSFWTIVCAAAGLNSSVVVNPAQGRVEFASLPAAPAAAGEVASVFGRTGAVVAKSGDYTAAQVTGALAATKAAKVEPATGTVEEVIESLRAAGIMS